MKQELQKIKERNKKVEADKAWEVSNTRKAIIAIITYIFVYIFLILIKAPNPEFNSLVPTAGFLLSTLTLNFIKKKWIKRFYNK